jgi:hypothetical protein
MNSKVDSLLVHVEALDLHLYVYQVFQHFKLFNQKNIKSVNM